MGSTRQQGFKGRKENALEGEEGRVRGEENVAGTPDPRVEDVKKTLKESRKGISREICLDLEGGGTGEKVLGYVYGYW